MILTAGETVSEFLKLVHVSHEEKDGWLAHCPSHQDNNASLKISEGQDGRVLLICRAHCSIDQICQALKIPKSRLFPQSSNPKQKKPPFDFKNIVATYDYIDEQGNVLYQVIRDQHKNFMPRKRVSHADPGESPYVYELGDVRRILYQLPEVMAAVAFEHRVYIVEGEKDADNIRQQFGLVATTNIGGTGQGWREEYTKTLEGAADVVIIPDNDEAGKKHAHSIREALRGKVKRVKILRLPDLAPKGDVSDWIQKGGTRQELELLADNPPMTEGWISVGKLIDTPMPDVEWIVEGILSKPSLAILSGDSEVWKSWTCDDLAIAAVTDGLFLQKFPVNARKVMLVTADEDAAEARRKLNYLVNGRTLTQEQRALLYKNFFAWIQDLDFGNDETFKTLEEDVVEFQPDIVIVDHLRVCFPGNENDSEFARLVKIRGKALTAAHPCCVIWHHHWRKQSQETTMNTARQRIRGSGAFVQGVDHHIAIERSESDVATVTIDKNKKGKKMEPFCFVPRIVENLQMATLEYSGDIEGSMGGSGVAKDVLDLLRETPIKWKKPDIMRALEKKHHINTVTKAIYRLEKERFVTVYTSKGRNPTMVEARECADWSPEDHTSPTQPQLDVEGGFNPFADND